MTVAKKIEGGTLYITYQDNGWIKYYAQYEDGNDIITEEWYERG